MRTVNRNVISLIHAKESGKASKNTEVLADLNFGTSHVYLFGKHIATYDHDTRALWCTDAGWQTVTTKDRLNALLAEFAPAYQITQRNHVWYIDSPVGSIESLEAWQGDNEGLTLWPGEYTFH